MSAHGPQLDWFGDPAAVRRRVQIEGPDDDGKVTLNLRNPQATLSLAEVPTEWCYYFGAPEGSEAL